MDENSQIRMGRYRALMTETDREHITGESDPSQDQKDQSVYRVRERIREELPRDIDVLREHRPDVLDELRGVVCGERVEADPDGTGDAPDAASDHLRRALDELPPSVPGRACVEDALAELDRDKGA